MQNIFRLKTSFQVFFNYIGKKFISNKKFLFILYLSINAFLIYEMFMFLLARRTFLVADETFLFYPPGCKGVGNYRITTLWRNLNDNLILI